MGFTEFISFLFFLFIVAVIYLGITGGFSEEGSLIQITIRQPSNETMDAIKDTINITQDNNATNININPGNFDNIINSIGN